MPLTPEQALDVLRQLSERVPLVWADQQLRLEAVATLQQKLADDRAATADRPG